MAESCSIGSLLQPGHWKKIADPSIGVPDMIFASAAAVTRKTSRPADTVAPLAALLGKKVFTDISHGEEDKLVQRASAIEGVVLISWHHETIPRIANLIAGTATRIPRKCDQERFDLVWVFDEDEAGSWNFRQVPQQCYPDSRWRRQITPRVGVASTSNPRTNSA